MYAVYILRSRTTLRYYCGHTEDLENRIREHNSGESKSTRHGIPWECIFVEEFELRGDATRKEKIIKLRGMGRFLSDVSSIPAG